MSSPVLEQLQAGAALLGKLHSSSKCWCGKWHIECVGAQNSIHGKLDYLLAHFHFSPPPPPPPLELIYDLTLLDDPSSNSNPPCSILSLLIAARGSQQRALWGFSICRCENTTDMLHCTREISEKGLKRTAEEHGRKRHGDAEGEKRVLKEDDQTIE
eukprot:766344-Hanusia_phi.AAC.1